MGTDPFADCGKDGTASSLLQCPLVPVLPDEDISTFREIALLISPERESCCKLPESPCGL
jgi:hypothetical protein